MWAVVREQVQHWDGTRWTPRPVPVGKVTAIDGTDAHDLWAVGHRDTREPGGASEWTQPTATHWDGGAWRRTEERQRAVAR